VHFEHWHALNEGAGIGLSSESCQTKFLLLFLYSLLLKLLEILNLL
jgi:hypothetical protein